MSKATSWDTLPILLSVTELKEAIGLSKHHAYGLANAIGLRVGKRLMVPKDSLKAWFDRSVQQGGGSTR